MKYTDSNRTTDTDTDTASHCQFHRSESDVVQVTLRERIARKRATYEDWRRLAFRLMLGVCLASILTLLVIWDYEQIADIVLALPDLPRVRPNWYAGVMVGFLGMIVLGGLVLAYCQWRISDVSTTELYYLDYEDGTREAVSEQDVLELRYHQAGMCGSQTSGEEAGAEPTGDDS